MSRFEPRHEGPDPTEVIRWYAFRDGSMLVRVDDGVSLPDPVRIVAALTRHQYLGLVDTEPSAAAELPADFEPPEGHEFRPLRSLFPALTELDWGVAGRAAQIVAWDRDHQYCGRCGTATVRSVGERSRRCPACGLLAFPRLSPAVIVVVTRGEEILLGRSRHFVTDMYSCLAGFVDPGETLKEAVSREILEEVSVSVTDIRYHSSQPWPFPHSLMIGFTARHESGEIVIDDDEIEDAGWFTRDALPMLPPSLSIARKLIDDWIGSTPA